MPDSPFKRYRQAFSNDAQAFDPSRILSAAMQPPAPLPNDPPQGRNGSPADPPQFDIPNRSIGQNLDYTPVIDHAFEKGEAFDRWKAQDNQFKQDQVSSMFQGFAQGVSAGVGGERNFGEAFAAALGTAAGVTRGSMQQLEDRRAVETAREMEIEDLFFNRSVKLQELSINRRKAQAEAESDILDRQLRGRQIDISERRAEASESRLDELERHNRATEEISRTNAAANTSRAETYRNNPGGGNSRTPRTGADIDAYARQRVYLQFGATDEQGNVLDPAKKQQVDKMLAQPSTRRQNSVQKAYEKARTEATRTTVDASDPFEDDSQ